MSYLERETQRIYLMKLSEKFHRYLIENHGRATATELAQHFNVSRQTASRVANDLVATSDDVVKGRQYREVESPHATRGGTRKKRLRGRPETVFQLRVRSDAWRESRGFSRLKRGNGRRSIRPHKFRRDTAIKFRNFDAMDRIMEMGEERMAADPGLKDAYDMVVAASLPTRRKSGLTVDEAAEKASKPRSTMYRRFRFLYDHHLLYRIPSRSHRPKNGAGRPPDVFIADYD